MRRCQTWPPNSKAHRNAPFSVFCLQPPEHWRMEEPYLEKVWTGRQESSCSAHSSALLIFRKQEKENPAQKQLHRNLCCSPLLLRGFLWSFRHDGQQRFCLISCLFPLFSSEFTHVNNSIKTFSKESQHLWPYFPFYPVLGVIGLSSVWVEI